MVTIDASVERAFAYHRADGAEPGAPGSAGMKKLRDLFARNVRIEVPMAEEFLDEQEHLITLTQQQAQLLNRFGRDPRMVITGPAGSGKTMLAVEKAKSMAGHDKDVLFICFNRQLRDHLREREKDSGVTFHTFHGLCVALAKKAEIPLSVDSGGAYDAAYFNDELPLALIEACEKLGPMYDALIVDEAQDLNTDWLESLRLTLRDPEDALIWLFLDDNQRVFANQLEVPKEFRPFDLTVNCRNTKAIHEEVMKKYEGEITPEVLGPDGREVELYLTADQPKLVRQTIERLCGQEEVMPQDIVVLSSHALEKSAVGQAGAGNYSYVKEPEPLGPSIRFSSIRAYKGLESPVVILCELEDIDGESIDKQLYVGLSRARNHCVVVGPG